MNHKESWNLLNDYIDGTLPKESVKELEGHIDQCEKCRQELDSLRSLLDRAAELPAEIQPAHDLWPGIRSAIDKNTKNKTRLSETPLRERRSSRERWSIPSLIAVSALLILFLSSIDRAPDHDMRAETEGTWVWKNGVPDGTALAVVLALEKECRQSDLELRSYLVEGTESGLPPGMEAVQRDLETVGHAVEEVRCAWLDDPGNSHLASRLIASYRTRANLQSEMIQLAATAIDPASVSVWKERKTVDKDAA